MKKKKKSSSSKNKQIKNIIKRNLSLIYKENKSNSIIKNILSKTPIYSKDKSNNLNHSNVLLSTSRTGINSYYNSTKNKHNNIEFRTKRHRSLIDHHSSSIFDNNLNNSLKENLSKNSIIEYDL